MKFKKILLGACAVLAAVSLAACSNSKKSSSASSEPKELNVEFVPSTQANKMEAKAKPLGTLLQKQLHIPVHVTVSTDYSGLVEAMSSKKELHDIDDACKNIGINSKEFIMSLPKKKRYIDKKIFKAIGKIRMEQ